VLHKGPPSAARIVYIKFRFDALGIPTLL